MKLRDCVDSSYNGSDKIVLNSYEKVTSLTFNEAREFTPGLIRLLESAVNKLISKGVLGESYKLPGIFLCGSSDYTQMITMHTTESNSPHNDNRGFASFNAIKRIIYIDIETVNQMLEKSGGKVNKEHSEQVESALIEELIHADTTVFYKTGGNVGYVKIPSSLIQDEDQVFGFYSWSLEPLDFEGSDESIPQFKEDEREICATENLTHFSTILTQGSSDVIVFLEEDVDINIRFVGGREDLENVFARFSGGRSLTKAIVDSMKSGNMNSIEQSVIKPFSLAAVQMPKLKDLVSFLRYAIHRPNSKVIGTSRREA